MIIFDDSNLSAPKFFEKSFRNFEQDIFNGQFRTKCPEPNLDLGLKGGIRQKQGLWCLADLTRAGRKEGLGEKTHAKWFENSHFC